MKPTYKTKSNLYRKVSGKKGLSNSVSYQSGGTLPPIYTSDPNDLRVGRYNDSLNLYNAYQFQNKTMKDYYPTLIKKGTKFGSKGDFNYNKPFRTFDYSTAMKQSKRFNDWTNSTPDWYTQLKNKTAPKDILKIPDLFTFNNKEDMLRYERNNPMLKNDGMDSYNVAKYYEGLKFNGKTKIAYHNSPDIMHETIKPIGSYYDGLASSPVYKKPVQPVLYADPKIVEKQKKLKEAGLYTGELDGIWGKDSKKAWKKYEESLPTEKTSTTTTTSATTTTAVKPPVVTKPAIYTAPTPVQKKTTPQPSTDTPWRFMLGNDSYQTFDEETAKMFAKDLGITNLQRGDNKNIDPATKKYRDYSSLVTPGTTNTGTTGTITKYPKLKRMEYGGQIAKGSRLKKVYTAYKTRQ